MVEVHPSAIVQDGFQAGEGVRIGPYCTVGPHVVLGDNVDLRSHVIVSGRTTIGAGTVVYPFASIGEAPQDIGYRDEPTETAKKHHHPRAGHDPSRNRARQTTHHRR
jgi:UDP-N-acetylglucosamine acyltransferase